MDFNTFCNVCYYKENVLELYGEEYNIIINILISLTGEEEIIKENKVYLCTRCCGTLKNYDNFRKMVLTNLVHFRREYKQVKKEFPNDPDLKMKLEKIVEDNVFKESSLTQIEDLKENEETSVTNTASSIDCFESTLNTSNTIYVKTEYCDESFNNLESSNLEDKINIYNNDESYLLPIKEEVMDEDSTEEDINPIDKCSTVHDDSESKLHTEIDLGIYENALFTEEPTNCNTDGNLQQDKFNSDCVVPTCPNTKSNSKNLLFHALPRREELRNTWLKRINRADLINTTRARLGKILVCGEHFAINQYRHPQSKRLNFGALPNIVELDKPCERQPYNRDIKKKFELKCKICNKDFTRHESLLRHEKLHTGNRPYECKICHGKFMTPWNLNRHLFVHSGEKSYQCTTCSKFFPDLNLLRIHQSTCTTERRFKSVKTYLRKRKTEETKE